RGVLGRPRLARPAGPGRRRFGRPVVLLRRSALRPRGAAPRGRGVPARPALLNWACDLSARAVIVPVPEFIVALRQHIGHAPLWLIGITAVVIRDHQVLLIQRSDNRAWT